MCVGGGGGGAPLAINANKKIYVVIIKKLYGFQMAPKNIILS